MKKVEKCLFSSKNVPLTALPSHIYIYIWYPSRDSHFMVFPTLFKPNAMIQCTSACLNATKHLLASMLPNICLAQRNQNSVRASNFMFFTIRQIQTWDFRLEILKSEQLIHGSKIQDFRKLLSRNLGSMDPRSKISENSCPEVLDPSRNLGSM